MFQTTLKLKYNIDTFLQNEILKKKKKHTQLLKYNILLLNSHKTAIELLSEFLSQSLNCSELNNLQP